MTIPGVGRACSGDERDPRRGQDPDQVGISAIEVIPEVRELSSMYREMRVSFPMMILGCPCDFLRM
jgi:hypothetical protein